MGPAASTHQYEKEERMNPGTTTPRTYLEWVGCLDAIDRNEDMESMVFLAQEEELEWTSGVAERFTTRLCGLIDRMLTHAAEKVQINLDRVSGDEMAITFALLDARKAFRQAYALASLPVLPESTKTSIQELVLQAARTMNDSLEESAKRDRTGKMLRLVRNVPVWPREATGPDPRESLVELPAGRKVIYHE